MVACLERQKLGVDCSFEFFLAFYLKRLKRKVDSQVLWVLDSLKMIFIYYISLMLRDLFDIFDSLRTLVISKLLCFTNKKVIYFARALILLF